MIRPLADFAFDLSDLHRLAPPPLPQHADEPDWLGKLRDAAVLDYRAKGMPTLKTEDWRFTGLDPIVRTHWHWPPQAAAAPLTLRDLEPFLFAQAATRTLIFIDGLFAADLSTSAPLKNNAKAGSLAAALRSCPDLIQQHLNAHTDHADVFGSINLAFALDGAFIHVPRNQGIAEPIHLLFVSTQQDQPTAVMPRNLVVCEEGAQVTVIEDYVSIGEGVSFVNAVTQIHAGANSKVEHYLIERENLQALNVNTLHAYQQADSNFSSHSVLLGGRLVRNNVQPVLDGTGCQSLINGLYIASGQQHMDNHMRVEHAQPHGDSRQIYKGILDGHAHGAFTGRIVVRPGAQKTDAKQTNSNLLLSENARADTRPQLEIYADDVKCTHGATIGQVDDEAIFYLRSRGISEADARAILVYAFAGESLARMQFKPLQQHVQNLLLERLPHVTLAEELE